MPNYDKPALINLEELSGMLGFKPDTVRRWIKEKRRPFDGAIQVFAPRWGGSKPKCQVMMFLRQQVIDYCINHSNQSLKGENDGRN